MDTYCEKNEIVLCHKKRHAGIDLTNIQKNSNDVTTNQNISAKLCAVVAAVDLKIFADFNLWILIVLWIQKISWNMSLSILFV